jgi:hypothetical protein
VRRDPKIDGLDGTNVGRLNKMEEWVMNELYEELIHEPLWTLAAFKIEEGTEPDKAKVNLMTYLITCHMNRVPNALYDNDYRHDWKLKTFVPVFKSAVNTLSKRF